MTSSALSVPRGLSQTLSSRNIGRRCNNSICAVSVKQQVVIAPPTFLADETGRNPLATRHEMPLLGKRVLITGAFKDLRFQGHACEVAFQPCCQHVKLVTCPHLWGAHQLALSGMHGNTLLPHS